ADHKNIVTKLETANDRKQRIAKDIIRKQELLKSLSQSTVDTLVNISSYDLDEGSDIESQLRSSIESNEKEIEKITNELETLATDERRSQETTCAKLEIAESRRLD